MQRLVVLDSLVSIPNTSQPLAQEGIKTCSQTTHKFHSGEKQK